MNAILFGAQDAGAAQLFALFGHFFLLSLLAVGGAIATAPDMHRFIVADRGWLSEAGFSASIALAQAAPGPNVLFVAVIGWNVAGLAGVLATLGGNLLPSTTLALSANRWGERNRHARALRAFKAGMAPLTLGLLLATGWILTEPTRWRWACPLLVAGTVFVMLRTRLGPLWCIAAGAAAGVAGWI
jgi:chromate transporter